MSRGDVMQNEARYESKGLPIFPRCGHDKKAFKCDKLTAQDIRRFHENFYKCKTKISQDNFILKYCTVNKAKNKCHFSRRKISAKYHIINKDARLKPVCQKTFLGALLVNVDRVKGVINRFYTSGGAQAVEGRGGDRKSMNYKAKRLSVQWFIEKFKAQESHYCRTDTKRLYLPPELNIRKMWRMYNSEREYDLKVKQSFFRKIFCTDYNIGFGSPRTDVCSTCISLQEQMKAGTDPRNKNQLITEKRIHRLKYKAFYKILQEDADFLKTITFDCQKNQALPKLPDQSAYYSRQFSFYHFAIVEGNSKAKLNKENVHSYYWTETSHNKGSNEIISAVYHYLQQVTFDERIKILRVVCDGCSGQNKNTEMLVMLGKWLYCEAPRHIKKIEIIFPVVGHSFIPPDRVFAKIERELKKKEVLTSPAHYVSVLKEHASVTELSSIPVYDWKTSYEPIIKPTTSWNFPFMKSKRFFLSRTKTENIFVQGEMHYKSEINKKILITKKNKKITMINPRIVLPHTVTPKSAKVNDVIKLLEKHFGSDWRNVPELEYYKSIEERLSPTNNIFENNMSEDENCEHGFEDNYSHI
ncbi:unnamed protein product [Parnassius mnemosyne]|uniref:DUF7869 domain-containing protein n=1 Tax=Parnassius mnemosyne TaxID=213953 RepID=A0AAV1L4S0_9NEOP